MIKKLRIKFVCIVMAIAMLMVGGILGVVIHFTATNMEMQSVNMMRAISTSPFQQGNLGKPQSDEVRLPFFTVQISNRGEMITAGGGYFDLSDRAYLQQIVDLALESGEESGVLKDYDLRYLRAMTPMGLSLVFADTATEVATLRSMVYSSLFIFLAAMLVFLGISVLLSRWAIKPVATAWDQQRQFVADASHELKTPLAVIMANAELMQHDTNEGEIRKFSANILSMTYQMRSLVENMLEMARVDNGTVKMHFTQLDLSELIRDAVERGCRRFILGIGGSATNDGGTGMLDIGVGKSSKNLFSIRCGIGFICLTKRRNNFCKTAFEMRANLFVFHSLPHCLNPL